MVDIGVLEEDYYCEWASMCPKFAISKENGTIRDIDNFRKQKIV
jgi:hypothetical protein